MADLVGEGCAAFPGADPGEVQLLYSAHSIPARYVEEGDPYLEQTQRTVELIDAAAGQRAILRRWRFRAKSGR